jgi:transcriptional regulator with XRE-family HTH domain
LLYGWLKRSNYLGRRRDAADFLGIHEATLSQFINGDRTPGLAKGVEICEKTGVSVEAWAARLGAESAREFQRAMREVSHPRRTKALLDAKS